MKRLCVLLTEAQAGALRSRLSSALDAGEVGDQGGTYGASAEKTAHAALAAIDRSRAKPIDVLDLLTVAAGAIEDEVRAAEPSQGQAMHPTIRAHARIAGRLRKAIARLGAP